MTAAIIGVTSGLLIIFLLVALKQFDKRLIYGLVLSAIGFIYVGFAWMELQDMVINSAQAVIFLFIAYFGIKKNLYILAAGFFLHGCWDIAYPLFNNPRLIPPHYDLFCLSIDWVIGIYILVFKKNFLP